MALLGGCKFQVTGPTAAFVVILAPVVSKYGLGGLLTAGLMAGVMLVAMGIARLGSLIQYIPHPVTTGFTTASLRSLQHCRLKTSWACRWAPMPEHYVGKLSALWQARGTANPREFGVAAITLALLLPIPRVIKKVPAPLIAIVAVSLGCVLLRYVHPDSTVATIGSRFHTIIDGVDVKGIPSTLPSPSLPWGMQAVTFGLVHDLFPAAFAIAMLGAIESLLSAVIADGLTNTKHDPNSELVALGIGNIVAPIFGGITATGALARTATNIRAGARSPFASVTHAIVVLLATIALAPCVAYVPMASLAGLLLLVAWNMSEIHGFVGVLRIAPKSDVFGLVTCFGLTVFFDMVIAVSVGFVLAAILFMRRMSELTESRFEFDASREGGRSRSLPGILVYEINGPLFFGAAQKALAALRLTTGDEFEVLVIRLARVPVIDATGLVALENAIASAP